MPQEFLRDVLRTGDTAGRRRRHWSVLPISIAGHALLVAVLLLNPWMGIDLPVIGSPLQEHYVETVAPPPPPAPTRTDPAPARNDAVAPSQAPDHIAPETEAPSRESVDGAIPNGPGMDSDRSLLSSLSGSGAVALPPPPPPDPKPVRVGGTLREPRRLVQIAPVYPELARLSRVEGIVVMEAILDATGRVESVRILRSVPLLDDAAVKAVRQWRYTPTALNGVPVPVLMTITVRFSLER